MVGGNDKIDFKNKLNVDEYMIFEFRESKSILMYDTYTFFIYSFSIMCKFAHVKKFK
jgi:hypothetical protein